VVVGVHFVGVLDGRIFLPSVSGLKKELVLCASRFGLLSSPLSLSGGSSSVTVPWRNRVGEKALWPTVVLVSILIVSVSVLLTVGVNPVSVIAVFSIAGNVLQVMLYGKIQKIETNTNGANLARDEMLRDLLEHAKRTVPLEAVKEIQN
jgi:hypothetical protein